MNVKATATTICKHLDLLGLDYSVDHSAISKSTYISVESQLVIRVSDHDLPFAYQSHGKKILIGGASGYPNWEKAIDIVLGHFGLAPTKEYQTHVKRKETQESKKAEQIQQDKINRKQQQIDSLLHMPKENWERTTSKRFATFRAGSFVIIADKSATLQQAIDKELQRLKNE
jgi:hypothetical protein